MKLLKKKLTKLLRKTKRIHSVFMFDVCVLGAGPGGYVAAIRCAKNGLSVACVEKDNVGGVCLNWGCIPTKALLHCAELCNSIKECSEYGIYVDVNRIDIGKIVEHSRNSVKKLTGGVEMLFKKNKISLFNGYGIFKDKNTIEVQMKDGRTEIVEAKYFIIATGASARKIDGYDIDERSICTYRGAMIPDEKPEKVAIIGSGVIGIEFASFYNSIGSDVVILDRGNGILSFLDDDIRKQFTKIVAKKGIKIISNSKVLSNKKINDGNKNIIEIVYEQNGEKTEIIVDKLILAVGVIPNISGFGLEKLGVVFDKNVIKTDEFCKTNIDNIYAIGDCTYGPWLAHKASKEGILVADKIAHIEEKINKSPVLIDKNNIPSCIYSFPQIACVGLTEQQCIEQGIGYKVGTFSGVGNGKSIATNESDNFIKIILDGKTGELLGCHMMGKNATEIIHSILVGKTAELLPDDFENVVFAHPTVSEMIPEAILDTDKNAIHK